MKRLSLRAAECRTCERTQEGKTKPRLADGGGPYDWLPRQSEIAIHLTLTIAGFCCSPARRRFQISLRHASTIDGAAGAARWDFYSNASFTVRRGRRMREYSRIINTSGIWNAYTIPTDGGHARYPVSNKLDPGDRIFRPSECCTRATRVETANPHLRSNPDGATRI